MRNSAINMYSHLVARKTLPLQKKIQVTQGTYLTLLNRKNKNYIFALSKSGQNWNKMIEDINKYGKLKIELMMEEPEYIIFTLSKQKFKPTQDWIHVC